MSIENNILYNINELLEDELEFEIGVNNINLYVEPSKSAIIIDDYIKHTDRNLNKIKTFIGLTINNEPTLQYLSTTLDIELLGSKHIKLINPNVNPIKNTYFDDYIIDLSSIIKEKHGDIKTLKVLCKQLVELKISQQTDIVEQSVIDTEPTQLSLELEQDINKPTQNTQLIDYATIDMRQHIRENFPEIIYTLTIDRTVSQPSMVKHILMANNNYNEIKIADKAVTETTALQPKNLDVLLPHIKPRAFKSKEIQKLRTKTKAEVFTPSSLVKQQIDAIFTEKTVETNQGKQKNINYKDNVEDLINSTWLEITCGEAPYLCNRYEMDTGIIIPLKERTGFIDRKIQAMHKTRNSNYPQFHRRELWWLSIINVFKTAYAFEWSGDSLLLARENLLHTFIDYYLDKWNEFPKMWELQQIADIISYNVFQADGLTGNIPFRTDKKAKVMNWQDNKFEVFLKEPIKKEQKKKEVK